MELDRMHIARQHLLMMASTRTWMGFWSVSRWMISKECLMMRTAIIFLPLLRPCCISESVTLHFRTMLTNHHPTIHMHCPGESDLATAAVQDCRHCPAPIQILW